MAGSVIFDLNSDLFPFPFRRTEEATQLASCMDSDLQDIHNSLSHSHAIIETCRTEFETLPSVVKAVEAARQKVEEIGKLLKQVEEDMLENSRTTARLEAERRHHSLKIQSEKRREQQALELKRLEGVLAEEKRLTVERQLEMESQKIQERQQTFQDIFDQQMADYRERGEVERPISGERERSGSQLEEVEIEDEGGTASLNEFLSDVVLESPVSPEPREGSPEPREGSAEREKSADLKEESHEQKEDSGDQSHDQPEGEDEDDIFHDVSES